MHPVTQDGLERLMSGKPEPHVLAHLDQCPDCQEIVGSLQEDAAILHSLRPPAEMEPAPGFYARVIERIEAQRSNSIWGVFLEPLFARRLVYASAILTVILGVMLFTSPKDEPMLASSPEQILAEELPGTQNVDTDSDRNTVFVQLATFDDGQ